MKRVLVIGGGIAGLSSAYFLSKSPEIEVALVEPERLGGSIRTEDCDGFLIEAGPDAFLSEKPAGIELALELGLEKELISTRPEFRKALVARGARAYEIPKGFYLMAPADPGAFLKSPILSWAGKCRALAEPWVRPRLEDGDESVGSFIRRRFGQELLARIGQPMVAGVYTGDPEELSLRATFPKFSNWERNHGSVIRGMLREKSSKPSHNARGPRYGLFVSFRRGMETLVRALSEKISAVPVHKARVENLRRESGVWTASLSNGARVDSNAVVLASGARASANGLRAIDARLAGLLDAIPSESVATIQFAFGPGAFHTEPDAVGLVVPAIERRAIVAATFADLKFEGRVPRDGSHLVRAYAGGAFGRDWFAKTDAELVAGALADLRALAGVRAEPLWTRVFRHPGAMVQYTVGHLERVSAIERAAGTHPGLYLTGAPYRGLGIPDCVAHARQTAVAVQDYLKGVAHA